MEQELKNRILACVPAALREALADTALAEMDDLRIAWDAARDYEERLALLRAMAEQAENGEIRAYARELAAKQEREREAFFAPEPHMVYDLAIRVGPEFSEETFLCADMDAAAEQIAHFWADTADLGPDWVESAETSYELTKRRIHTVGTPCEEDVFGRAYLRPGSRLYRVDLTDSTPCEFEPCVECEKMCVYRHALSLPCIIGHGRPARYRCWDGSEQFGVVLLDWGDGPTEEYYIIPLTCQQMKEHRFDDVYWAHEHVDAFLVEPVAPEALPERQRKDWEAFYAFLQEKQRSATDENQKRRYFP